MQKPAPSTPPLTRALAAATLGAALALGSLAAAAADAAQAKPAATAAAAKPAATKPAAKAAQSDPKADASYSLGLSVGSQFRDLGLTLDQVSIDKMTQGIRAGLGGTAQFGQEDMQRMVSLVNEARALQSGSNRMTAMKFLEENGKKPGVQITQSGLQYKVLKEGEGDSPKPTDQVTVHYRGTLLDGREFDSSYARNQPATFPANGVIPGWQEALQLMKKGGKYELYVAPDLAYGDNSRPPIPPGSLLKFEVELLDFKAAPAAAAAPPAGSAAPGETK